MRKFLIATLMVKLVFLLVLCPPLSVLAESGSGGGVAEECAGDPTKYALDANGDEVVDLSDVIWSLSWLFSGGQVPRVCLDTTDLEANLATAEGERDAAQIAQATAEAAQATAEAAQATAEAAQATAEGERDAALAALALAQAERDDALADLASCQDAPLLCGCTDSEALNYNPEATVDDGSCIDGKAIPGFTFVETNTEGYDEYTHDASGIRFVLLPGGEFEMGSPDEAGRDLDEGPVHTVSLSSFLIAKYEVTQAEYAAVMTGHATLSVTPSFFAGDDLPVEQVSLDDLKEPDGFLGRTGLSLPSEAQWEYACRAGSTGPFAGNGLLDDMGWFSENSEVRTHDVGTKQANDFGLHDMHGNVNEWCEDVYSEDFYASELAYGPDPLSTEGFVSRVIRGGYFLANGEDVRSANRESAFPNLRNFSVGFRPVRLPAPLP